MVLITNNIMRFDIMINFKLISSYDEINDMFSGKIVDKNGYLTSYNLNDGIFINMDKNNYPSSFYIYNASRIFNISKKLLECPDISIKMECDKLEILFEFLISNKEVYVSKSWNTFNIPEFSCIMETNY